MTPTYLGGAAEVAINETLIPATLLSEVAVEFTGGTRETETLGGTFTQPSGVFETAQATFTLYLPSMDYLKVLFPDLHNASSGSRGLNAGNVVLNTNECLVTDNTPVNIHYVCDGDDDKNDVFIPNARVNLDLSMTFNSDALSVEVTVFAQPDENGDLVRFGSGNLAQVSHFDATTMTTVS